MSSAINVYAVSVQRLEQILGSRDRALIDAIVARTADFLASIDEIDDEAELTCADAVADLINGETSEDAPGYLYGYALEAICAHVGVELPNICPIVRATDWIEEVDAILDRKGIPIRLERLVFGGSPVPIPEPDDYPAIGHWPAADITGALAAFVAIDVSDIAADMAETIAQVRDWLKRAAKIEDASIVGFLS